VGTKVPAWETSGEPAEEVLDITSPYDAFCLFLTDEFIDTAVEESKKYAISKGAGKVGTKVLLSGYNRLLSEKMYWEDSPDSLDRVQEGPVGTLHPGCRRDQLEPCTQKPP